MTFSWSCTADDIFTILYCRWHFHDLTVNVWIATARFETYSFLTNFLGRSSWRLLLKLSKPFKLSNSSMCSTATHNIKMNWHLMREGSKIHRKIQTFKRLFREIHSYKENTVKWSYSSTCHQEMYKLATLDYCQLPLVLKPFPNNKQRSSDNILHVTPTMRP